MRKMDGGIRRKKSGFGKDECERRNGVNETEMEVSNGGRWGDMRS